MRNLQSSYEEYNQEKVEKKSKEFLKIVMGNEKFDKLQKDGKIEIETNNKKNEKTIYELYSNGKIINKTRNQSYCIVADRSDYPTDDVVAIKYAWLVHRNEIAEKVANKTNLYTGVRDGRPRVSTGYTDFIRDMEERGWNRRTINIGDAPYYGDYVDYLSENSWRRELITLDELNPNLVSTYGINKDNTGCIIDIKCPPGQKMSIMGLAQTPRDVDANSAYSLGLYVTDENGKEIPDDTKIMITKEKSCTSVIQLSRIFYSDMKMKNGKYVYRFHQGIELNSEDYLRIFLVDSKCTVSSTDIKFKLETDIWTRNT